MNWVLLASLLAESRLTMSGTYWTLLSQKFANYKLGMFGVVVANELKFGIYID